MIPITKKVQMHRGTPPANQEVTIDAAGKIPGNFSRCKKYGKIGCSCGSDCGCGK